MTLNESPDLPVSAFTFYLWQTVYSFWANSKSIFTRLLMSTHSVWGFYRLLQAYAYDNTGWQSLPEKLYIYYIYNMLLIQNRDHDITVTWDFSSLVQSWLRISRGQLGLWNCRLWLWSLEKDGCETKQGLGQQVYLCLKKKHLRNPDWCLYFGKKIWPFLWTW